MSHIHWVSRQNKLEIPNDEEEVIDEESTRLTCLKPLFVYYESMKRKLI
jgi:hypothetical protein